MNFLRYTIKENNIKINSIISASGIGAYPSSNEKEFDETEKDTSNYFLADVIKEWEKATMSFKNIAKNVSIVRIGLVLSKDGGVLKRTMQPMSFGFGVYFGKGNQWQSWIHIKDISRLFLHINEKALSGTYNGVAPTPLSNFDFIKMVSKIRRGVLFLIPVPRLFFRLIFGEMHIILFKSQKVSSEKIQSKGFTFIHENLENTLKNILQ